MIGLCAYGCRLRITPTYYAQMLQPQLPVSSTIVIGWVIPADAACGAPHPPGSVPGLGLLACLLELGHSSGTSAFHFQPISTTPHNIEALHLHSPHPPAGRARERHALLSGGADGEVGVEFCSILAMLSGQVGRLFTIPSQPHRRLHLQYVNIFTSPFYRSSRSKTPQTP
jgi:hypothetical protein